MARNGAGVFAVINPTLVAALRSSTATNSNFTDAGTAITGTLPLDGTAGMTGQFKGYDGSLAAPGMAFSADTNTGFRRSTSDEMRWVGGGTDRFYIDIDGKAWFVGAVDVGGAITVTGAVTGSGSDPFLLSNMVGNGFGKRAVGSPVWSPDPYTMLVTYTIGGMSTVLPTGIIGEVQIPAAGTITSAALAADQTGSCVVYPRKCTYANYSATRPSSDDGISGGNPLTITSGVGVVDTTLSGWTTSVAAGDVIRFSMGTISSITRLTIALAISRLA